MIIKIIKKLIKLFKNNILKRFYYFLKWNPWIKNSYSQEGEDMVLQRIFENYSNGFFVDVGAHHPMRFSNTYIFYQQGWKGINIDPIPGCMKVFNRLRPRDINIELGVAEEEGELNYYVFNETALNSFSKELSEKRDKIEKDYYIKKVIKVEVKPLYKILEKHLQSNEIDFLNVDVEGLDLEVLRSNDWSKYRPKFVLVEALETNLNNFEKHPIFKLMKEKNYTFYAKQVNTIFFKDNFLNDENLTL